MSTSTVTGELPERVAPAQVEVVVATVHLREVWETDERAVRRSAGEALRRHLSLRDLAPVGQPELQVEVLFGAARVRVVVRTRAVPAG